MKPAPFLILLILFLTQSILSQAPAIGDVPPELDVREWVQGPADILFQWEDYRDRVVIVEFWATWCAPCLPAKKHLQRVSESFDENKLVIIAVSNEERETVENYISRYDFDRIRFALDNDNNTANAYKPQVIPHSVMVGPDGIIAAVTYSNDITHEAISDLLAGKEIDLPVKKHFERPSEEITEYLEQRDRHVFFRKEIVQSTVPWSMSRIYRNGTPYDDRRFTSQGLPLRPLTAVAFDVHPIFVVTEENVIDERFDVDIIIPYPDANKVRHRLRMLIEESLGLEIDIEKRETDVRILKLIDPDAPGIQVSTADTTHYSMRGPSVQAVNQPIRVLTDYLSNFTGGTPVVDGTGLSETYDFSMDWNFADQETLYKEIKRLGFKLVEDRREIDMVVIKLRENGVDLKKSHFP